MRSRPSMTVMMKPGVPHPGQTLEVEARLEAKSETPVDQVSFELVGTETVRVKRGKSTSMWQHSHVRLRAAHPGKTLSVGPHTYSARFDLPRALPPQYLGRYSRIDYTLEVRVDIPWWPDRVGTYDIPVTSWPVEARQEPGIFVSERGGARAGELYTEMSLASTTVEPGGEISGTVAFTNVAHGHARGVRLALIASERLFADAGFWQGGSIRETREVMRSEMTLRRGPPEEGVGIPFRVRVAPETIPSLSGTISALEWKIVVIIERLISNVPLIQVPILIVPRGSRTEQRTASAGAPAVGRERRIQSFQHVGAQVGLAYDAERDDLHGAQGSVETRIAVETRPDGALATVAHLSWPALGMGLRLAPGAWTDRLVSREIDVGHPQFDRDFHVRSRVPDQAKALLDKELCDLLLGVVDAGAEVHADDEGASLTLRVALIDEQPLASFAALAVRVARAFNAAFERVPPPPALVPHAEAWRSYAAQLGGRFEPGRCAIHDATFALERVAVVTLWSDDGEHLHTEVQMAAGAHIDPETVAPAARNLATAVQERSGGTVSIGGELITLSLAKMVANPAELEPSLEDLAKLLHAVRGRGAAGPFR